MGRNSKRKEKKKEEEEEEEEVVARWRPATGHGRGLGAAGGGLRRLRVAPPFWGGCSTVRERERDERELEREREMRERA